MQSKTKSGYLQFSENLFARSLHWSETNSFLKINPSF